MMNGKKRFGWFVLFVTATFLISLLPVGAQEIPTVHVTSSAVRTHPSQGDIREIEAGLAELITTEAGAMMSFRTAELEDGHVYTVWWVVVNNPSACSESPCPTSDILGKSDLVESDITWGDSLLVDATGRMEFAAFLPAGAMAESWYGNGFTNPMGAEIHVVINDHGPLIPDLAANMLNTYRGGCTDESLPPPFPNTAKADGVAGPNACRLVQFAVFQQDSM